MQLYLRFLRYLKPYRLLAVAASLSFIISGFLSAYPIQLFKRAVDVAVGDVPVGDTPGSPTSVTATFILLAAQYILLRVALGGVQLAESYLSKKLIQNIAGMREIQIFGRESHELNRFQAHVLEIDRIGLKDATLNATLTFLTGLLFSAGETVVLLFGGLSVYGGAMTPGMLTAFLMYVRMLYNRHHTQPALRPNSAHAGFCSSGL